jgi:hypothetical protein
MGKFETRKLNFAYCNERHKRSECHKSQTCATIAPGLGRNKELNYSARKFTSVIRVKEC